MMGNPKKAEQILRQAAASPTAAPKVRENLALVLGLQGRYDESKSVASSVTDSDTATSNTNYLKQLVKLEPKSEMPDASSFMAQTSVEPVTTPQASRPTSIAANAAPMSEAQSNWQPASVTTTSSLRGMTH